MNSLTAAYRNWKYGRKFTKIGKRCKFTGRFMEIEGHVELGDHCRFRNNVILRTNGEGKIIFGNRSGCSYYCIIEATRLVQIGSFTALAEFCVVRDTNHMVYGTDAHFRYTPLVAAPVIIGSQCLIGSRCYIGPGVTIGDGAVVAAGSVVTKSIGPYEIWAGVPAKFIAHRTKDLNPEKLKFYQQLVEMYGVREDRYMDIPKSEQSPLKGTGGE